MYRWIDCRPISWMIGGCYRWIQCRSRFICWLSLFFSTIFVSEFSLLRFIINLRNFLFSHYSISWIQSWCFSSFDSGVILVGTIVGFIVGWWGFEFAFDSCLCISRSHLIASADTICIGKYFLSFVIVTWINIEAILLT